MALEGCTTKDEARAARNRNPAPCPSAVVLQEAARLVEFVDGEAQEVTNVAWSAEIENVTLQCRYFSDRPIEATVDLSLAFGRGPRAEARSHQFSYFVAVTRANREVIAKQTFPVDVAFGGRDAVERVEERIDEIIIPRARESISGANFEVVVGLVLDREQVLFNRSGKSLKFPSL